MNDVKPMGGRWTVVPGANGFVIPFDSTRGPANMIWTAIAAGSTYLSPGPWRSMYPRAVMGYSIRSVTQAVTVDEQIRTRFTGASTDWETQGVAGTFIATAGTTFPREFKPLPGQDFRLLVTGGATPPDSLEIFWSVYVGTADYGN